MLLKGKLGSKSWAMEVIVEAVRWRRGGDSLGVDCGFSSATNQLQFCLRISCILAAIGPRSGHDRAVIGPRSRHDRATIVVLVVRRSTSARLAVIPPCKLPDRGSIGPRSWSSSTKLLNRPMKIRSRSTRCSHRARSRPSDEDPPIKIALRASP